MYIGVVMYMAFGIVITCQVFVVVFVRHYMPAMLVQKQESLLHRKSIRPSSPEMIITFRPSLLQFWIQSCTEVLLLMLIQLIAFHAFSQRRCHGITSGAVEE